MKAGRNPQEFVAELERQANSKRDWIAPANWLTIDGENHLNIRTVKSAPLPMNDQFQSQVSGYIQYPWQFWQRSRDSHPGEWRNMVNAMLADNSERRMVRALDGRARAFLSRGYKPIDNFEVAMTVLKALGGEDRFTVVTSEITESKMYLKIMTPLIRDVKVGDPVQAGFSITNSEIGLGFYEAQILILRLRCVNGMITPDANLRRMHIGPRMDNGQHVNELFSNRTQKLTDKALLAQTRDLVKAAITPKTFEGIIARFAETTERKIEGDPGKAIEVTAKQFHLSDDEKASVLRHFVSQGDGLTQYGLVNAVTAAAQTVESFDRSVELEEIGGKIVDLPASQWKLIATAGK